ncbi:3-isopropylmalate dehydratase large subunit [Sphingorhabdus lacus]|uniref:3-isopropylmalate dehydratase large subunit n=1 Tax=Sphingorhabdus lacus TaxID=392610 RepID=A0A6I6L5C9_9SPHN|nr:3-isopropylmalate dehydratase large subunit [Sphingorhabdus lacus]QGY79257.1 3-isopropylmalate dehydratase large subunit [Sphingorhabdus lacus]
MQARTLSEKIWEAHRIRDVDTSTLLYIDRHFVFEVTSPQAFESLRDAGRQVRRPDATLAVADHNIPTLEGRTEMSASEDGQAQLRLLRENTTWAGISYFDMNDRRQGIVHVIGPELGLSLPGMTIACGDSHTATHGAFGSLAFGIGTSEVEHVLATQTLLIERPRTMRIIVEGALPFGVTAKDLILTVIGRIGTAGARGHILEFAGPAIKAMSMEARMTVVSMSIEAGARCGLVAPDQTTLEYLKDREYAPKGSDWDQAVAYWQTLFSDDDCQFDRELTINANEVEPTVTWGTSPEDTLPISGFVPDPADAASKNGRDAIQRSIDYMGLRSGQPISDLKIDRVFIGSCTNGRLEDLRSAAEVVKGRHVASHVRALVVPGSTAVKQQAESEGLDKIFLDAGFEWRESGCSMCVGLNADQLGWGERCAATSNRNFEGRQGAGGRTHLASPPMAAAAAIFGHFVDVRVLK